MELQKRRLEQLMLILQPGDDVKIAEGGSDVWLTADRAWIISVDEIFSVFSA